MSFRKKRKFVNESPFGLSVNSMRIPLFISFFLCAQQLLAQPFFPGSTRLHDPYGVCTHVTRPGFDYEIRNKELPITHDAGISWVRSDLDFHNFFTSYTTYSSSVFDSTLASVHAHRQHLLGILTRMQRYSWDDPSYASLVEQLAKTYDGRITHWEAQNEVNLFKGVDHLCEKYIGTLKTTYETLKRVNPENVVLTSGFAELPENFIGEFSQKGGWRYCDVFNFHTYFTPEGLVSCFERLHKLMQRDGWERPVWITECGMHTANDRQSSARFFTDLLPAALRRIGMQPQKLTVGVLNDPESGYYALTDIDSEKMLLPYFHDLQFCSLRDLSDLSVSRVPVLIATCDEYFPKRYFSFLVDYVRRGGTIVLAGGMPFYYDAYTPDEVYFNRRVSGTSLYAQLHLSVALHREDPVTGATLTDVPPCWGRTSETSSTYEWSPTHSSPARYMSDDNLAPGDSLIPLVQAGTQNLQYPLAGIYRFNSELKGNVVFQTRMYAQPIPDKEAEQARRVARLYLIAFAYGVDKVFWYNLRSREKDMAYSEDCFGLLHHDFTEKPSMQAYRTLVQMCPSGSLRPTLEVRGGLYHASWQKPDGAVVHALWSPTGRQQVRLRRKGKLVCYNHLGLPHEKTGKELLIDSGVTYVVGPLEIISIDGPDRN